MQATGPSSLLAFGRPLSTHPPKSAPTSAWNIGKYLVAAGAVFVVVGVPAGLFIAGPLAMLAIAGFAAMMLGGVCYLYDSQHTKIVNATSGFAIFEDGFAVWKDQEAKRYFWRDVAEFWSWGAKDQSIWSLKPRTGANSFRVVTHAGEQIEVSEHVEDYRGLMTAIGEGCTDSLWERAQDRLASGREVALGRYSISTQGIRKGDSAVAWKDISRIVHVSGRVSICQFYCHGSATADLQVYLMEIPNHGVFHRFLDAMAGGARDSA